ncbi:MAG: SUMF1/EgtB/PvdO family nonheme iron enzyme [Pseudomonadota bacterium]
MKNVLFKLIERLTFLGVVIILGFITYWQTAQYKKIEKIESLLSEYQLQLAERVNKPLIETHPQQIKQQINDATQPAKQIINQETKDTPSTTEVKSVVMVPIPEAKLETEQQIEIIKGAVSAKAEKTTTALPNLVTEPEKSLIQCKVLLDANHLTRGHNGNAYDCYSSVLQQFPDNKQAKAGLLRIARRYQRLIKKYIKLDNIPKAEHFLSILSKINPQDASIPELQLQLQLNQTKSSPSVLEKEQDTQAESTETPPVIIATTKKTMDDPVNDTIDKKVNSSNLMGSFIKIKAGCFNKNLNANTEKICINEDFLLAKYEVTQKQWFDIMGNNPSRFKDCGTDCPIENISWFDIQGFIRKLNQQTGKHYRLPSSYEWEYAARAGSNKLFSFGDNINILAEYGNFCDKQCANDWKDKSQDDGHTITAPIGSYKANAWDIYDMHGNVWEWVADQKGDLHVYRGGSWGDNQHLCQSSSQGEAKADFHVSGIGFRLVLSD